MWKDHRRFSISMMRDFGMGKIGAEENIQYESEIVIERFRSHRGQAFDPLDVINMAVSNIICTIAFGKRFEYEDAEFKNALYHMNEMFRNVTHPAFFLLLGTRFGKYIIPGRWKMFLNMYEMQLAFVRKNIEEHKERYDGTVNDVIDGYLKEMETEKEGSVFGGRCSISLTFIIDNELKEVDLLKNNERNVTECRSSR